MIFIRLNMKTCRQTRKQAPKMLNIIICNISREEDFKNDVYKNLYRKRNTNFKQCYTQKKCSKIERYVL